MHAGIHLFFFCGCFLHVLCPPPRALWPAPALAFVVPAVHTAEVGCDSSVGARLKSPPHSWLAN